jgi:hypothetical protein
MPVARLFESGAGPLKYWISSGIAATRVIFFMRYYFLKGKTMFYQDRFLPAARSTIQHVKASADKVAVAVTGMVLTGLAMAQTADPGVDAITDLSGKATTYITAAFGVAVLIAGGFWGIKMMKKSFSKAG